MPADAHRPDLADVPLGQRRGRADRHAGEERRRLAPETAFAGRWRRRTADGAHVDLHKLTQCEKAHDRQQCDAKSGHRAMLERGPAQGGGH